MRFRFIEDRRAHYPVRILCDVFDVAHPFRDDLAHHSGMMSPGVTRPLLAPIRSRLSARRGAWMLTERLAMRHVGDVIRMKAGGLSSREIAPRRFG
jgi:hypothetical protein